MPANLPADTRVALGPRLTECNSRALFFSRFAEPDARDTRNGTPRKDWFSRFLKLRQEGHQSTSWHPSNAIVLYARLQCRLLIGMGNGVMENAGLTLDRYGLPYLPGSAVKGCVRRTVLAALREWTETNNKPAGSSNVFTALCGPFVSPVEMLVKAALTFGWVELDWKVDAEGESRSDLAWACGSAFPDIWNPAAERLAERLEFRVEEAHVSTPWRSLHNYAGDVAFLAAKPNRDPGLVLDVLTPHHTAYYKGEMPIAIDNEDPVPVFFPAVRSQGETDYFTFPMFPLRRAEDSTLVFARRALAIGLEAFGIGAKTNAGYGWFNASEEFGRAVASRLTTARQHEENAASQKAEAARLAKEDEAKREAEAALRSLTPEQREDEKIKLLTAQQFDTKVRAFCKEPKKGGPTEDEQKAIVRALRGPRSDYWQEFKTKATKGEPAKIEQAIRAVSKTMNLGKMP